MGAVVSVTEKVKFIQSVFGTGRLAHNSQNFDVRCPICDPKDRSKLKLSIHVADDRTHCWVCGFKARTLAPLVRRFGTPSQLAEYRDRFMPEQERHRTWLDDGDVEAKPLELPPGFKLLATASLRDPDVLAARKYLAARQVTERDLWYFKLGISPDPRWRRRVVMPSFDATGALNYFTARAIDARQRPKYDAPEVDKLPIVFNELNLDWTKELVVCEGPFDLMKCPDNSVPLLGSDINEEGLLFNRIIANGTPVALALDADMLTRKTPRHARKLAEYDVAVRIVRLEGDPGNMSKGDFRSALDVAKPFNWQDAFLERLGARLQMRL